MSMINDSEQLGMFLQSAVMIELAEQPLPNTREQMAWTIGKIVQATINRLKLNDTIPIDYRYKDIVVDFDQRIAFPKYRVTVSMP